MGRNTPILQTIIRVLELDDAEHALDALESHFHDVLLVNAGNVTTVATAATPAQAEHHPGRMFAGVGLHR